MDRPLLEHDVNERPNLLQQTFSVLWLALPLAGAEILFYFNILLQVAVAGRLGAETQSAWFLARGWYCITGLAVVIGTAGALETFVGQAWGAGETRLLGILLQRGVFITFTTGVLLCPLQLWAAPLLRSIGQDEQVAKAAGDFCIVYMPAMLMAGVSECQKRFLVAQGHGTPVLVTSVFSTCCSGIALWFFMTKLAMGLPGIALSTLVYHVSLSACMTGVMVAIDRSKDADRRSWQGWSTIAFQDWSGYLSISLPSTTLLSLDWGIGEITMFLAGLLPNAELALSVFGITSDTATMAQMSGYALGAAAATCVANHLGARNGAAAKIAAQAALLLAVLVSALVFFLLLALRSWWIGRLTSDPIVALQSYSAMVPALFTFVGANVFVTLGGVLRGTGRQKDAAVAYIMSAYVVGLPLEVVAAVHMQGGVPGLWWAQAITALLLCAIMIGQICRLDWNNEQSAAATRLFRCRNASFKDSSATADNAHGLSEGVDPLC